MLADTYDQPQLDDEAQRWLWDVTLDLVGVFVVAGLAAEGSPTGRREPKASALHLAWIAPDNSPFDSLRKLLFALLDAPHLRLVEQREWVEPADADEVDADDPDGICRWKRGRSTSLPALQRTLTTNTPEHRIILAFLQRLQAILRDLSRQLAKLDTARVDREDRKRLRADESLAAQGQAVSRREGQLRGLLGLPLFEGVTAAAWSAEPTGVFLHQPLYRRIFDLMQSFERMPEAPDEASSLVLGVYTCERWRLFELWSLFRLRDALSSLNDGALETPEARLGWFDESGELRLTWGQQQTIALLWPDKSSLRYQQTCAPEGPGDGGTTKPHEEFWSVALTLAPDFIVTRDGQVLILDAKCMSVDDLGHHRTDCHHANPYCRPYLPWQQAHVYRDGIRTLDGRRPDASLLLLPEGKGSSDKRIEPLLRPAAWRRFGFGAVSLAGSKEAATDALVGALRACPKRGSHDR